VQTFIFRCPATSQDVQSAHDGEPVIAGRYIPYRCVACGRIHLVNPTSGKLAVEERLRSSKPNL